MVLKEDKEKAINGKQVDSVQRGDSCSSDTMKIACKTDTKTAPPSEPQTQRKEKYVEEKRTSEARIHLGSSLDSRAKTT